NVVYSSNAMTQAASSVWFTSPLAVLLSSLALTDSSLLAAVHTGNFEAQLGALGANFQEQGYLESLRGLPDEWQRREEYYGCKKRFFDSRGTQGATHFEAVKYCTGGFQTTAPVVSPSLVQTD